MRLGRVLSGAALLLLSCAAESVPTVPMAPLGTDTLGQHQPGKFAFYTATDRIERVRYIAYWGDNAADTSGFVRVGDTVEMTHTWSDTGLFSVRSRAQTEIGKLSDLSTPHPVLVRNYAPQTPDGVFGPDTVRTDSNGEFRTVTTDPEADVIAYTFAWGNGDTVRAPGYASGDTARMLGSWSVPGEYEVRSMASDPAGHASLWSTPHRVVVLP
ncbi:hypothetical protein FJY68_07925 [candidate division WOR-3 bacterium]|uniref:PKD domain-containing protein n=1 Tax=candidate division WOR-3 bacterium TaxID=2052148 RepID=A0A937XHK0_UNCW3|nr:hypothetical protein [candidate division WOR-3 bacterium]